jgi:hypothetical protein
VTTHHPRPRYGRLGAAAAALVTTVVTLLGGIGVLPADAGATAASGSDGAAALTSLTLPSTAPSTEPVEQPPGSTTGATSASRDAEPPLPDGSGTGKRVVFDISDQRVWLVDAGSGPGDVRRTYLVSGSVTDNLVPGTFAVYSRSRWATGIGDSGVMQYFTRFTRGDHAAIGFHSIPTKDGRPLQTLAQLGTPQSHGCIRQAMPDAKALWAFAPEGTKVVVTA